MPETEKTRRRAIGILSLVTFAYWFALYAYSSYLTPYLAELGASGAMSGLVIGSYGLAMLVCRFPIGLLADRIGRRKPFIVAGAALTLVSALGMALARSAGAMLFFRTLSGIGVSTWVCYTVLFSSYYPAGKSSLALANANLLSNAGRLVAGIAGAAATAWLGMRGSFWCAAAAGALGLICSFFVKEERICTGQGARFRELFEVIRTPSLLFAGLITAVFSLISYATGLSFVSNLAVQIGATDFQIGLLGSINALGGMVGLYLTPRVFERILPEKQLIIAAMACSIVGCFLFPLAGSIGWIYLIQIFVGVTSFGLNSTLMNMAVRQIPEQKKSSAMGAYQAIYAIGILIGPTVMGAFVDAFGYLWAFRCITIFGFVGIAATLLCYDRTQVVRITQKQKHEK